MTMQDSWEIYAGQTLKSHTHTQESTLQLGLGECCLNVSACFLALWTNEFLLQRSFLGVFVFLHDIYSRLNMC